MQRTCRRKDKARFEELGFAQESDFDDPNFACDGKTYLDQATDGDDGGFVVTFDEQGNPEPASLAQVKDFIAHWNKVSAMLAQTNRATQRKRIQRKKGPRKRRNARLAQAPTFNPLKEK